MDSPIFFEIAAFLLGALLGSFLNVCISRLPLHQSVVKPRSRCGTCGATVVWFDNVPVVSWLLLQGRCRNCATVISWRYPAVEAGVGAWFALMVAIATASAELADDAGYDWTLVTRDMILHGVVAAVLGFFLIGLAVMDWRTHRLPDVFTYSGMLVGFVLVCVQAGFLPAGADAIKLDPRHSLRMSSPGSFVAKGNVFLTGAEHVVLGRLLAMALAAGVILAIRWLYQATRGREGLGLGDAKLMAMIAAFLGFWPAVMALLLGVVSCAGYALVLILRGRASAATKLPLGTFLALGGLVAALAGTPVIAWYSSLL